MRSSQDPALLKALASELKARRAALGMSQDELAFSAGINRTFVAKLELATTSPSLSSLFRLSNGLNAEPWELILAVQQRYEVEVRTKS
ncbi:helix-turn-helix domain-containing protein [Variovorax sp. ZT4R33]|uniref:helix-turn-helix domain-containing protein n=1 Tax=Variovorax sp. ZT4R33 TaxID=3443743 RepID=UPI003F46F0A2